MTKEELQEILKDAPTITEEEFGNEYYSSTYELLHEAIHDFNNDCMKIDRDEGWDKENRVYAGSFKWNPAFERFNKVDFEQYRNSLDEEKLKDFVDGMGEELTVEDIRMIMYGYTFTKEYEQEPLTSVFSINWWKEHLGEEGNEFSRQEELIAKAIVSTGDGRTPETAFCVIDLYQEYEILPILMPEHTPLVTGWSLLPGNIDCLELESNEYGIEKLYFDIHRRFEVGMDDRKIKEQKMSW